MCLYVQYEAFFLFRMATKTLALWLLLVGTVTQGCCQHWSYGLSPGGKRELDSLSDTLGNVSILSVSWLLALTDFLLYLFIVMFIVSFLPQIVEAFPHEDAPCTVFGCAEESPLEKIYRMKGFRVSFAHFVILFSSSVDAFINTVKTARSFISKFLFIPTDLISCFLLGQCHRQGKWTQTV